MKKTLWWILGILLSPVLLFLILTILIYLPPVQNWAVDKVATVASEKTGMQIAVDRVRLSFPLDLAVDGVLVRQRDSLTAQLDTVAAVERLVVDVRLWPLLNQKVVISQLEVTNTRLNTMQLVAAARVKGSFSRLSLYSRGIDLSAETVELNGACLEEAAIDVALNDSVPEDTTTTENRWVINLDQLTVRQSDVALHMPGDTMSVAAHFGSLAVRQVMADLGNQLYSVGSVDWDNGALRYDQNFAPHIEGLDPSHIDLSNINIGIDSIRYSMMPPPMGTLSMVVRQVALREQSGLQITHLSGAVKLADGKLSLPAFRLKTPESDVLVTKMLVQVLRHSASA